MTDACAEVRALADRYFAGELTAAEADRLNDLLRGNPAAQRAYLEVAGVHARLRQEFGPTAPAATPKPAIAPRSRQWTRRARWVAVAGLAAAVVAAAFVIASVNRPVRPVVAVLRNGAGAQWVAAAPELGAPLFSGRLQLARGVVEIEFGDGALAVLEGPAEIDLLAPGEAFLHTGQVVVRMPGDGFGLETPTARIVSPRAEFGVGVGRDGSTVLQVYDGSIRAEGKKLDNPQRQEVESGRAVRFDPNPKDVAFWPERFVRILPGPNDPTGRGPHPYNRSRFDTIHIVPPPGRVVIDADLSDWDLSGQFRSWCEPPYGDTYHLEAAMMYDDRFLYVAAHVGDPFPMRSLISPRDRRELYGQGGGVALRVSTDRRTGWPLTALGPPAGRALQPTDRIDSNDKLAFLMLWHHAPTGEACLHARYGMDLHGSVINPPGVAGAYRRDADGRGYTLEYAIPWAVLHAADNPPQAGDTLAAMWLAHWSDPGGRTWQGQLIDIANPREPGWNFERAATWGKAIYHARGKLTPGTVAPIK
jgi:anti-sigma factor RsiW